MSEEKKWTYDKSLSDYFTQGDYNAKVYGESNTVKTARDALNAQLAQKPGAYQSQWQTQLNDVMGKIMNREKFSYDLNGDALYQQYKDKYIQQGKMASADVMGQAAAMTGGYGNSYAASVGNQAYQASLQQLNDKIPELYQLAYDRYNQEGQDLLNQYGLISDRDNTDYSRHRDTVSDYYTERDYLAGRYDSERSFDYTKYADQRDFDYTKYNNDRNFAYQQYTDDKNLAYTDHRNEIADSQWKDEYDLAKDKASAGTTVIDKDNDPKYIDDPEKISEWSGLILDAETEAEALRYIVQLEQISPALADSLYEEWLEAHKKPGKVDTTVTGGKYNGVNGQVHMLN